jgi:hypothetical protein
LGKAAIPRRRYNGMKGAALCLVICLSALILPPPVNTQGVPASHRAEVLVYAGRYFESPSSPDYAPYDQKMSMDVAKRIREKYQVDLDYKLYTAFDLLEIEALLKCKKSDESVESLLRRFQS